MSVEVEGRGYPGILVRWGCKNLLGQLEISDFEFLGGLNFPEDIFWVEIS